MAVYDPSVFLVNSIDEAKRIILTDEGIGTDTRWQTETPYLVDLIEQHCHPAEDSLVLDYGCGIGRLAKPLIEQFACNVVGVDISAGMRALASVYTNNGRFMVGSPNILNWLGIKFDVVLTVWTLQHCLTPKDDIALIKQSLKPDGLLFVVNNVRRAIPVSGGQWADDGINVKDQLSENFTNLVCSPLDPEIMPGWTFYGVWQNS